ncbi:MAG: dephospho-CoA kinase [SAR86 cluster bacterium]|jgi:dephospho-CoA kinase|nr:dephospho-CoA kinase [SAR86 cluster bacterium]MDG1229593.1 dephospho-CoA kinase [SAR86 cluster bacterium]|tara:strand:- start:1337 stop:1921 length:585 start_codon:yes stop_codon:yes gene_type:complete
MIIGLTGGIGSGKTAVSDSFEALGIDVVDADLASRVVVQKGKPCLLKIAQHFGEDILTKEAELDRAKLREIIFKSEEEKNWLESLLHPAIANQIQDELNASKSPYTILVSPLLLETNQKDFCSKVLAVDVPVETQVERTLKRDGVSKEQVQAIINSQISRNDRLNLADEVIVNDGTLEDLEIAVKILHEKFLSL